MRLSSACPGNNVKSLIPRKYSVCVFGCSPLIRMSSRNRWRSAGTYWSDIETSHRQIEKILIVEQGRQFTKSQHSNQRAPPTTSANTARAGSSRSAVQTSTVMGTYLTAREAVPLVSREPTGALTTRSMLERESAHSTGRHVSSGCKDCVELLHPPP